MLTRPTPELVTPGDTFDVEWTVRNIGAAETTGSWQDRIYLSDDPYFGNDLLLTAIDHADALATGTSYTETLTVAVPDTAGPKYVLVRTRLDGAQQREAVDTNNLGVSPRVLAVDVPQLELGASLVATGTEGQWDYYRFEGEPGRTVRFALDGQADRTAMYLRRTLPPTLSNYDISSSLPNQSDRELRDPTDVTLRERLWLARQALDAIPHPYARAASEILDSMDTGNNAAQSLRLRAILAGFLNRMESEVHEYERLARQANEAIGRMNDNRCEEPDPEDEERDREEIDRRTSYTPEDKYGPAGYDAPGTPAGSELRFIPGKQAASYRIDFWNKPDAVVPTQDAIIIDRLDPSVFDLSTLEITRVGFLNWDFEVSSGQVVDTRIDCAPEMNIAVEIKAGLGMRVPGFADNADIDENTLVFWFHAIDPATGEWPEDPMAGFLPPYNSETGFEIGWIEFTVDPVEGLPSGTRLANVAYVEFDFAGDIYDHPAPKVDPDIEPAEAAPWINTIDAGAPTSQVEILPPSTEKNVFTVRWNGQDDIGGSGIASYDIYVAVDNGPFERWLEDTTETEALLTGEVGYTYAFYSVATDNVGHREAVPPTADAMTVVGQIVSWQNPEDRFDVNGRDGATAEDMLIIINYINSHPGDVSLPAGPELPPPYYDVNGDGVCTSLDLLQVINHINSQAGSGEGEAVEVDIPCPSSQDAALAYVHLLALASPGADRDVAETVLTRSLRGTASSTANPMANSEPPSLRDISDKHRMHAEFAITRDDEPHKQFRLELSGVEAILADIAEDIDRAWRIL